MNFEAMSKEEALVLAMKHFACIEKELEIVVVSKPEKKMMGLKRIPGVFEIRLKQEQRSDNRLKQDENTNGTVEIRNGKFIVEDAKGKGVDASIFINHDQAIITINGELATGNKSLKSTDVIEVKFEHLEPEVHMNIELSENLLDAYLIINRKYGKRYKLKDMEKTSRGSVQLDFDEISPRKLISDEVRNALLTYGILPEFINDKEINAACKEERSVKVIAARGIPPIESKKTDIYYCDEIFAKEILRGLEPVVLKGTKLAEKRGEAREGVPGTDVKGGEIKIQKVKDEEISAVEGAVSVGNAIFAERDGRPYMKKGEIGVVPLLTVVGDLDKDTPDIDFDGDVVVKGNVQDHMVIRATGNISVIGSVYHSEIHADQNIEIQGKVIGGNVQAGDENAVFQTLLPMMENLVLVTERIFNGLHMNDGRTVQDIMECISKGKEEAENVFSEIRRIKDIFSNSQVELLQNLEIQYQKVFIDIKLLRKEGFIELNTLYEQVENLVAKMKDELEDARLVKVIYVQNAVVKSSGDIEVTGEGSYQSKLVAGNEIRYTRPGNVVKGGTLLAGKYIKAGVVGTPHEIQTFCKVLDHEGDITGRFYKGTTLMIKDQLKEYAPIL